MERSPAKQPAAVAVTLAVIFALAPSGSAHAAGEVTCVAERLGARALTRVTALDLFDRELLRLVELGMVGRLDLEVVLFERRRLWFDRRAAEATRTFTVTWSRPEGPFLLDGARLANPRQVRFPDVVLRPEDGAPGDYYVQLNLRLQVITAKSLSEVARWLVARPGATAEPGASRSSVLPRALVDYLASDLAHTVTGRCPVPR